jgi:putative phosphoesterase
VRIAALSDIHGNLPALEAVLDDLESERFDALVVVGDSVTGPFSAEVFDRITRVTGARFVRGNIERMVLEGSDEHGRNWDDERTRLGDERLATIARWPRTLEVEVEGLGRVLVCHSTPASEDPIYTRITPDDELVGLFGPRSADVILCGHTHMQYDRRLSTGLRIVNPGSVGMPYEGRRGAYWALLGPEVEFRRSEYDVEEAARAMRELDARAYEEQLHLLLEPMDPGTVTAEFESMRGT